MSALTKYNLTFIILRFKKKKQPLKRPQIEEFKTAHIMSYSIAPSSR